MNGGRHLRTTARVELKKGSQKGGFVLVWQLERGIGISVNHAKRKGKIVYLTHEQASRLERGLGRGLTHAHFPEFAERLDAGRPDRRRRLLLSRTSGERPTLDPMPGSIASACVTQIGAPQRTPVPVAPGDAGFSQPMSLPDARRAPRARRASPSSRACSASMSDRRTASPTKGMCSRQLIELHEVAPLHRCPLPRMPRPVESARPVAPVHQARRGVLIPCERLSCRWAEARSRAEILGSTARKPGSAQTS